MPKILTTLLFCCVLLYMPLCAFSSEEGLYPAAPPPGSAFIRFLNGNSHTPVAIEMRGKSYGTAAFRNMSAYAPVPRGDTNLSLGSKSTSVHLKEGSYYTAILLKEKLSILEEPTNNNKLKAQIILINASGTPAVSLKTADGATSVINAVDTAGLGGRSVNAVKIPFSVYAAVNKIKDLDAHLLERGERYTVVVYDGTDGKPSITFN